MSKKGENIYKRKDGRWEARYIKGRCVDGKPKYGYCYAQSYREVRKKVSVLKADLLLAKPAVSAGGREKFSCYCDEWLKLSRFRVKESSYVKYYSIINKHVKPGLGDLQVAAITSITIEEFCRMLLFDKKLSSKTVKDILVLVKSILKYTRKSYPGIMADVEIIYPKAEKKETRVLTREEQKRLTDYLLCDMDNIKFGVLLTLMTGLRIGEICALRWCDVSLKERVIRVGATMQRIKITDEGGNSKTRIIVSTPKTDSSARLIPLTDLAVELCTVFNNQNPAAFVLSGSAEHFIEPRVLQNRLEHFTKDCGLEGVHYHTLRHSFATRCVEVGFEIKSLSEILGHSSPTITLERYIHSSMDLKRSNMDKLSLIGY